MRKERAGQGLLNQWRTTDPYAHRKVFVRRRTLTGVELPFTAGIKTLFLFMKTRDTNYLYHFTRMHVSWLYCVQLFCSGYFRVMFPIRTGFPCALKKT